MRKTIEITSKMLMMLACAIIMLHAVVPHHHHDCCGEIGFVFEDEVSCHCDAASSGQQFVACCEHHHVDCEHHVDASEHHDQHSHHPFDLCKLQDLLSHLVLTTKEDETYQALATIAEHDLFGVFLPAPSALEPCQQQPQRITRRAPDEPLPTTLVPLSSPLRAPPEA